MSNRSSLELSTRTVKIYSGAADAQARADIAEHLADNENPHEVTAEQVGLGLADNTSDADKPVSGPQAAALALKAPLASPAFSDVPTAPTAAPGTATVQLATTGFVQAALSAIDVPGLATDLAAHLDDLANPHQVSKAQVGLALADNTADASKPVSAPQQTALNLKANLASPALTGVPTAPTAAALTNTTQIATTAYAKGAVDAVNANLTAALALKAPLASPALTGVPTAPTAATGTSTTQIATTAFADAIGDALTATLGAHTANVSNPHATTKAQVGLGNADNTADLAKPVSTAQQTAINAAAAIGTAAQADIDGHQLNVSNPHAVTKAQVGLGNADNTADLSKPISTATQTALNLKAPLASPALTGTPTAPTAATGTSTTQIATTAFADAIGDALTASLAAHTANVSNPHSVTKNQVGLGSVDNTSDLAKPISTATAAALALKAPLASPALTGVPTAPTAVVGTSTTQLATTAFADAIGDTLTASLAAHSGNISNPHSVTKAQVGLGSVDNTSDAAKPVSTAQAAALALKANLASPALTGVPTAPTAAPGTSTTQLATTAFVDAIGDALHASIDGASGAPERPGDAVALYGTLATGTAAAMPRVDPTWVATSAAGNVVRVNSATADDPQVIAPAAAFAVGPVSDVNWQVQRQTDPIDPLNDSVTLAIRWLTNTCAGVAGAAGISTIANLPLVIANGIVTRTARIGGGGLVPPAGAVYFRPYVQLFGNNHVTDVIVLGVSTGCACVPFVIPITTSTTLPVGTMGLVLATAAAPLTVTMPASPTLGQTLTVKDAAGTATTQPITVSGGGINIEGKASVPLNINYAWIQLTYSGTQWVQV